MDRPIRDFRSMLNAQHVDDLKARVGKTQNRTTKLDVYVNHGRWVADCLCGSGVACAPDSAEAVCLECGSVYRVNFPPKRTITAVEKVLGSRPASKRNWSPGTETRADLAAENLRHAFPLLPADETEGEA
jgi:hypothetical protein